MSGIAGSAGKRCASAFGLLALVAGLVACAFPRPSDPPSNQELLRRFESGHVRLDCVRCRYDFQGADWLLGEGEYETLVLGILRSGDGSGRSWYLLGRVAEATDRREVALQYYRESLVTWRNPIVALWPLYDDVSYRMRRLATRSAPEGSEPQPAAAPAMAKPELVSVESLVVVTRPGPVGAFVEKLHRGDAVDVLDRSGEWEQVRLADGRVGWAWGAYTSVAKAEPPPKPEAAKTATTEEPTPESVAAAQAGTPAAAPETAAASPPAAEKAAKAPAPRRARKAKPAKAPAARSAAKAVAAKPAAAPKPVAARSPEPAKTPPATEAPAPPAPPPASSLAASGAAGILGCPLPRGASLSDRTHGAAGSDDHPTETYAIDAPAREIVGFYEREMERAGWRKSFNASEFLLYFEKGDRTVGVLIERKGGLFTLMGS